MNKNEVKIISVKNDQRQSVSPGNKDKKKGAFIYTDEKRLKTHETWDVRGWKGYSRVRFLRCGSNNG